MPSGFIDLDTVGLGVNDISRDDLIGEWTQYYAACMKTFRYHYQMIWILQGEEGIRDLATRLKVHVLDAVHGFREYLDNGARQVPEKLNALMRAAGALNANAVTAAWTILWHQSVSSMGVQRLANCMFIKINGPPLDGFDLTAYVKKWLVNHHSALSTSSKKMKVEEYDTDDIEFWKLF